MRRDADTDVVVVGGGPAGAAAAIGLARAGRSVALVDKATFPRDKTCGDGLTLGALRLLERLGLEPSRVASWQVVEDFHVRGCSGQEVVFALPRQQGSFAAVARRIDLDAALLNVAREAGVVVHDGHRCLDVREGADHVEVEVEGAGTIRADWLVAADGAWSTVRKRLGLATAEPRRDLLAFRQYLSGVAPPAAAGMFVWFEPDLLPGYAWSFPLPGGRVNIGFGIDRHQYAESAPALATMWDDLLERPYIRAVIGDEAQAEGRPRAWPIPAHFGRVPVTGRRTLFVGDAVAVVDPLSGEGISQALFTGILAADAIIRSQGSARGATKRYRAAIRWGPAIDHHFSQLLGRRIGASPRSIDASVRMVRGSSWLRRTFVRWLLEDCPRAILLTPHRWRRGAFSGPGAYAVTTDLDANAIADPASEIRIDQIAGVPGPDLA